MVNKAALGVIGVIVVTTLGGGLVLGTLMDDNPGGDDESGAEGPGDDGTGTPSTAAPTAEPATGTAADDDGRTQTPIHPGAFGSAAVAENVTETINQARSEENLSPLAFDGEVARGLHELAESHSNDMADVGYVSRTVAGTNVTERYRDNGVFETCKYSDGVNVYDPANTDDYAVLADGTIGDHYRSGDNETFVANESQAARLIVTDVLEDDELRGRLLNEHFERAGVGVAITRTNRVYVTVALCS